MFSRQRYRDIDPALSASHDIHPEIVNADPP